MAAAGEDSPGQGPVDEERTRSAAGVLPRRWSDLLDELEQDVERMAGSFAARVVVIPGYEDGLLVPEAELYETAVECIGLMIEGMRLGRMPPQAPVVAEKLGRRRAFQQVPAESLTTAVQLNFSVIWARLVERHGVVEAVTLVANIEPTWRTIDDFAAQVMTSYNHEAARIAQNRLNLRQSVIARLFAFSQPSDAAVARVAVQLGCEADADYTVLATDQEGVQEIFHSLASSFRHSPLYLHRAGGFAVLFWPAYLHPHTELGARRFVRASRVGGLARVPSSAKALMKLLEALDPLWQRPVDLDEGIPVLARKNLLDDEIDLAGELESALGACHEAERERIRETVIDFLHTGSAQQTAARLYCHRNTVLNRLTRFTELTGIDVSIPRQAVIVALAWLGPEPPDRPVMVCICTPSRGSKRCDSL